MREERKREEEEGREERNRKMEKKDSKIGYGSSFPKHNFNFLQSSEWMKNWNSLKRRWQEHKLIIQIKFGNRI